MISNYLRISSRCKYIFTAAITAFLTVNCVSSETDTILSSQYESKIGLKFPESIIDLACLANTFPSQFKQEEEDENNTCLPQIIKNYTEIKEIPSLFYDDIDQSFISNTYPSLGIKGLHLKVYETKKIDQHNNQYVFIVVRHQEHNSMLTDEMNEMMSLFGPAATVDRQQGNKELFGASTVSSMIRFIRQQLGLDYLPQAISMFNKIQLHYKNKDNIKYIFSGFSSGGLYAIVLALYFQWPAITFSSTGVEDIINIYYSNIFTDDNNKQSKIPPIFNFAHQLDNIPQLDCQLGTVCLFKTGNIEKEMESIHLSTIFGKSGPDIIQWLRQPERWTCTTSDNYNSLHGSCKRERLRWKDRMKRTTDEKQDL
ncbi:unnamed protein product [Rotaria socialis]|uniref:Uncharacterized protein n=1 Tax=Rotaria socialis TaxID=392032 RepID=A0A817XE52_9BILA|nr:unnamed protein product [Rotaria socialis]CAF3367491.1 unnamed protein product [Rotaria socialis]CAF3602861.1 unnamed protein product [Rotaria socialis]CAF4318867.1 unnamed protein product [Rotaria socialis]CAF4331605.1 unnamed protein product [Rotaria socialis]